MRCSTRCFQHSSCTPSTLKQADMSTVSSRVPSPFFSIYLSLVEDTWLIGYFYYKQSGNIKTTQIPPQLNKRQLNPRWHPSDLLELHSSNCMSFYHPILWPLHPYLPTSPPTLPTSQVKESVLPATGTPFVCEWIGRVCCLH